MWENKSEFWKWCKSETGNAKNLALFLNVQVSFVSNILHGRKQIPVELIPAISAYTDIRAKDLRPDIYEIFKDDLL